MTNRKQGIVNIHGREYETVAYRIHKFRDAHPTWTLRTSIVHRDLESVVISAEILDETGRLVANGHAEEFRSDGKINATSALENAETSAIGRALAAFGIGGTEFASADEVGRAVSGQKPAIDVVLTNQHFAVSKHGTEALREYFKTLDVHAREVFLSIKQELLESAQKADAELEAA